MVKIKIPGQGKDLTGNSKHNRTPYSYDVESPVVKPQICLTCGYFRQAGTGRWKRQFCNFTGESVPDAWSCDFWQAGGTYDDI